MTEHQNPHLPVVALSGGPRLIADIGATHARFALETSVGHFEHVQVLPCADYAGIVPLIKSYLSQVPNVKIQHAAFAIANPVDGDAVQMTNRDWRFSIESVRREFGLYTLLIVNDFTALQWRFLSCDPTTFCRLAAKHRWQNR